MSLLDAMAPRRKLAVLRRWFLRPILHDSVAVDRNPERLHPDCPDSRFPRCTPPTSTELFLCPAQLDRSRTRDSARGPATFPESPRQAHASLVTSVASVS